MGIEEESRKSDGREFHTAGAAALKPRDAIAKVVRTRETDNKLVFAERIERVGVWYINSEVSIDVINVRKNKKNVKKAFFCPKIKKNRF